MAEEKTQNYENHVRHDTFLYLILAILLAAIVFTVIGIFVSEVLVAIGVILNVVGTVFVAINARSYAVKLQDRIVRTEMRMRLKDIYKGDPMNRVNDFTLSQLIALRFASDAELAELSQFVLDEGITDKAQIKQMIKEWNPDHMRV